jgi:KDO2-lipid IV(A) lauroyltransferase
MTAGALPASRSRPLTRRRSRLAVRALSVLAWLLSRLPDRPLHAIAQAGGGLLWLVQPRRRALVRANLQRVCRWLAERQLATPTVAAAAIDGRALERLVRSAFGHYLRAYLEGLIIERYARQGVADRVTADDPAAVERAFGALEAGRGLILVGLHLGAIEVPALWTVRRGVPLTSPMETLPDPDLQAFMLHRRGLAGLRLIPTEGAHRELGRRLAAGEAVALVADRPVAGAGARVELFGAPARLPLGPAVLALETGAPSWAVALRRSGAGQYRGRMEQIELPAAGSRRERLAAFLAAEARAFERLIADAPEQWWTLFFPIWSADDTTQRRRGAAGTP